MEILLRTSAAGLGQLPAINGVSLPVPADIIENEPDETCPELERDVRCWFGHLLVMFGQ